MNNTDIADLLGESVDRLGSGGPAPAYLAGRALRRHRRRRTLMGTAVATGVATISAAAVLLATAVTAGLPKSRSGTIQVQTAAFVASRTERALTAAARGGAIEQISVTARSEAIQPGLSVTKGRNSTGEDIPGLITGRTVFWWYRGHDRTEGLTEAGKPMFDVGTTTATGPAGHQHAGYYTLVDYPARTWFRSLRGPVSLPFSPSPTHCWLPVEPESTVSASPRAWIAMIRTAMSCGDFKLDGHQWIGGVHTIKIVTEPRMVRQLGTFPHTQGTLWVNSATFLPVMVKWTWHWGKIIGSFQWLPPTRASLAALNVHVPAGFHPRWLQANTQLDWSEDMASSPRYLPSP